MVEVHALASGSSGNSVLVMAGGRGLLIDAGLGPRTLMPALARREIGVDRLDAILLTHEHDDHLRGAPAVSSRLRSPIVANRATLSAACVRTELRRTVELPTGSEARFGEFCVRSFRIDHDAAEPVGYVVEVCGHRIAYATDVGCPCDGLREALRGASLCILEANHDLAWLRRGPYPPHMKERVASDQGHLSNADAATLLAERIECDGPTCVWLAHLSAVNNSPSFARRFVNDAVRAATKTPFALDIALRDRPSVQWRPGRMATQLSLF
jgi:phosphoribosyl 1,2-cyclic phosphodiesterase